MNMIRRSTGAIKHTRNEARPGDPPDLHFDDFEDTEVEMLEMPDDNELGRGRLYFLYLGDQFAGFPKVVKLDPAPGK